MTKKRYEIGYKTLVVIFLFFLFPFKTFAQTTKIIKDTVSIVNLHHSPKKAALYSAVCPGLGQLYNKKYWKIPVIYAGFTTFGYFIVNNSKNYIEYRDAYVFRTDGDSTTIDNYPRYTVDNLKYVKNYYRRNLEMTIIFTTAFYILNIIDASVDAHLFTFDVSDDISMFLRPSLTPINPFSPELMAGLKVTVKF